MAVRKGIAPTRSSLMRLKEELRFATLGYELLDQKRTVLVNELMRLVDGAAEAEDRVEIQMKDAYDRLKSSVLGMGKIRMQALKGSVHIETAMKIRQRRIMGAAIPIVETDFKDFPPYFSSIGIDPNVTPAVEAFKTALREMGKLAEIKISIARLALQVKKTVRKVNALEKIAIPELKETVDYITAHIEESERQEMILLKNVKKRLEAKKGGING